MELDQVGEAGSNEACGWRKDGAAFPIDVSRARWIDAHGRPASGAILRDVTERRQIEAALAAAARPNERWRS